MRQKPSLRPAIRKLSLQASIWVPMAKQRKIRRHGQTTDDETRRYAFAMMHVKCARLSDLLENLAEIEGLLRIRVSSLSRGILVRNC